MAAPLTYSDYINDLAIIQALRIPQPPPVGQTTESWPMWHSPEAARHSDASADGVEWSPGDPWPRGGNWAHDEVLFIRTHQAFEVWFALILHELDEVLHQFAEAARPHRAALPRVSLAERLHDAPAFDPDRFPAMRVEAERSDNPDLAAHIRRMTAPGRHAQPTTLCLSWLKVDLLQLAAARLRRATRAMKATIPFFDVLATLTPAQFLQFRGRLVPASGFGSVQFREIELTLGLREANWQKLRPQGGIETAEPDRPPLPPGMLRPGAETPPGIAANCFYNTLPPAAWPRVARRAQHPSLRDLTYALLSADDLLWSSEPEAAAAIDAFAAGNIREAVKDWRQAAGAGGRFVGAESLLADRIDELDALLSHRENIVAALLHMQPPGDERGAALADLLEACLRLDEMLLHWRDAHIRFVESIIGTRRGTGGGGVQYLRTTIDPARGPYFTHVFPCLWHARSLVQRA